MTENSRAVLTKLVVAFRMQVQIVIGTVQSTSGMLLAVAHA